MQAYYYQRGLFEGNFAPGAWLGGFAVITGILGLVHGCTYDEDKPKPALRNSVIVCNILVAVLSVIMLGLAIGWRLLDPEGFMYQDCNYPFVRHRKNY
jgi:hypothetical protein